MRFLAAPLLLAAAAHAPPPEPAAELRLVADAEQRWVPFDLSPGNQIVFVMQVDRRPATAVLDTGVSHSVLSRAFAERHRLPVRAGGRAAAIGGMVDLGWTRTGSLTLGGLARSGGGLTVAALPPAATGGARPVDLLVGRDLLARHALDIDYAHRRFRLLASGRLPFAGATAPLRISPERRVYVGELTLGAARLRPVLIDTGDGAAVTVGEAGWRASGLATLATTTTLAYGLAGPVTSAVGVVPLVETGGIVARDVEVRIEGRGGFSDQIGVAGRIGSGFLQNYRVLLDPAAGRMVLRAAAGVASPAARSTSGLLVGTEQGRLRVLHVMRGSPAALAGWQDGEAICAVDGAAIPADYRTSALAAWTVGAPGRVVALDTCDGAVRTLTLRQFY